jgi:hypothetical protein
MELNDKLKNVKLQQEQAKEMFVKCQGAIEFLESFIKEQESSKKEDKKENKKESK